MSFLSERKFSQLSGKTLGEGPSTVSINSEFASSTTTPRNEHSSEKASSISSKSIPVDVTEVIEVTELQDGFSQAATRFEQILITFVTFWATFQVAGLTQAYGIFQSFHSDKIGKLEALLQDHHANQRGTLALIGTLSGTGIALAMGPLITPLLQTSNPTKWWFGRRSAITYIMAAGSVLLGVGYLVAAYASLLWHLIVGQGFLVGLGGALLWYPTTTVHPEYFTDKKGLAFGFTAAGSGLGGLFYSPIIHKVIESHGIRACFISLSISNLIVGLILALICPPPRPRTTKRQFLPRSVWKNSIFYLIIFAGFTFHMALGNPGIFGPDFGRAIGINPAQCSIWLAVLNGVGAPSRCLLGYIGDRVGRQGTSLATTLFGIIATLAFWLPTAFNQDKSMFWLFTILYGAMAAGFNQFVTPILLDIFGSNVFFSINAVVAVSRGIGSLLGSPIAGWIMGKREGPEAEDPQHYVSLIAFTAIMLALCLGSMIGVWWITLKERKLREVAGRIVETTPA